MSGYHVRTIQKGVVGDLYKLYEEIEEVKDDKTSDEQIASQSQEVKER